MKKPIVIITVLSILLNIGMVYLFIIKGETVKTEDGRTTIKMSPNNKDFVMEEMRDFLESVQKINEGILTNNPNLVISAGRKSGGTVIDHAPHGLLKSLPLGFKTLGFATHDLFDEFSTVSVENFDKKETQEKLNTLLNNCTSCHKAYKIEVKME